MERWIIVTQQQRQFFSLVEVLEAIMAELEDVNTRDFTRLPGNRR